MSGYKVPIIPASKGPATELPSIAGSCSGLAVVCGSGRSLWRDLEELGDHGGQVVAVNMAGACLKKAPEHWCSLHAEQFQYLLPIRGLELRDGAFYAGKGIETHSTKRAPCVRHVWPAAEDGSSALFAVRVALRLGFDRVVVCGVPLLEDGRFYDPPGKGRHPYRHFLKAWEAALDEFKGRVRSMSGATMDLLGAP